MNNSYEDKMNAQKLEQEIRQGRKFSHAEAIGRIAGPGMMKGVSPISGKQQADAVIEEVINRHLVDTEGALKVVMIRQMKASAVLQSRFDEPIQVLRDVIQHLLHSEFHLKELIRYADVEWGQMNDTRTYFEKEGTPPDPDDPFTLASVSNALENMLQELNT